MHNFCELSKPLSADLQILDKRHKYCNEVQILTCDMIVTIYVVGYLLYECLKLFSFYPPSANEKTFYFAKNVDRNWNSLVNHFRILGEMLNIARKNW